jgi:calpain-15
MSTKPHLVRKKSNSESKEVHVESLGADVHLYVTKSKEPYKVQYEIECNNFTQLKFTLDLHKSTNIRLMKYDNGVYVPEESLVSTKKIRPFSKTEIGYIEEIDIYKSSRISTSYQWITETPDEEETDRYMATYRATLKGRIDAASSVPFPPAAFDPENRKVIDIWNMHGKSFLDFDFLPLESSIFSNENSVLAHNNPEKLVRLKNIEWKRASDFMKADSIEVFQAGIEPADIIQGCLGDCWFLSALAALAEHPKLIHDIFPPCSKTYQQAGVYNVRFCKNGLWQTIRLDDYFPCFPGGGPIFSKSNGDELWVLLAEKAFAKIHGTYLAIQSGQAYEALMDLSGAPFQKMFFPEVEQLDVISNAEKEKIWHELSKFNRMDYILAASTRSTTELSKTRYGKDANSIGLVFNHAYSILDLRTTSHGDQIVKLR